MPLLFPNLRVTQILGANTDVGKTLLTTSLLRSTASLYKQEHQAAKGKGTEKRVFYLKPVSTGSDEEADDSFVRRNTGSWKPSITTKCLYQYREPVSPHLAAQLAPDLAFPKTNEHLLRGISDYVRECARESEGSLWLETAGGVHSPSLHSPLTQITSLRPLLLPTILIASPHLGGISTTLSSYESLLLRGYTVQAVLCIEDPYYRNHEFLKEYFEERGVEFWSVGKPPVKEGSVGEDGLRLEEYYKSLEQVGRNGGMLEVARRLEEMHGERMRVLESMPERTMSKVWWPFTQHGLITKEEQVMVIDSAQGDCFDAYYKMEETGPVAAKDKSLLKPLFDGSASWFTQSHSHGNPELTLAAAHAAGRYGHVLFPSGTHAPALGLAEQLLSTAGKGWASRVFFSDNGSTGMEVGLKMAMRASGKRYGWDARQGSEVGVIGLRGSYHGDTIGCMDAAEGNHYNEAVDWYKGRGHWFSPPVVTVQNGSVTISSTGPDTWPTHSPSTKITSTPDVAWETTFPSISDVYDVATRLDTPLAEYYKSHIRSTLEELVKQGRKFGALVIEPICLGAAGMVFVDPLFQRCMMDVVRKGEGFFGEVVEKVGDDDWRGLPVLFDEVFTGLHRLSFLTSTSILLSPPDILVNAKILTGGLLPLSTTMASNSMFKAFLHPERKVDALLHGHSYTAGPMGCAVAKRALEMVTERENSGAWDEPKKSWVDVPGKSAVLLEVDGVNPGAGLWSFWSKEFVFETSKLIGVKSVMGMGTVLAIELEEPADSRYSGYASSLGLDFLTSLRLPENAITPTGPDATFEAFHIHSRPLGNIVYFMTSLYTDPAVVKAMEQRLTEVLKKRA